MKKISFYLLSVVALLMVFSCSFRKATLKKISDKSSDYKDVKLSDMFVEGIYSSMKFDAVKISSKVNIDNGSFMPQLDAVFYIENNQKIWTNVTALFGIAGVRGIATPSGIKGYEKFNKTYIDSDFGYINKLLGVDFIDYDALQKLLTGQTFIPIDISDFIFSKNDYGYRLSSYKVYKTFSDGMYHAYNVSMYYDSSLNLTNVELTDDYSESSLEVVYSNRIEINGENFPKNISIIAKNKRTNYILIENTNFDFARMNTPYSVPSNYTKIEIK